MLSRRRKTTLCILKMVFATRAFRKTWWCVVSSVFLTIFFWIPEILNTVFYKIAWALLEGVSYCFCFSILWMYFMMSGWMSSFVSILGSVGLMWGCSIWMVLKSLSRRVCRDGHSRRTCCTLSSALRHLGHIADKFLDEKRCRESRVSLWLKQHLI